MSVECGNLCFVKCHCSGEDDISMKDDYEEEMPV